MNKTGSTLTTLFGRGSYSDVVLAAGVLVIVALMVLRLPVALVDALVAVNIAVGIGLLLVAIYIPSAVAFNSFPSVLLIATLFRLALSVATTRLILLGADAGHIIDAFGRFVAGGNLVVGVVVFIIITVVQFIVIAKGAERVAEVAARFTLDAMPGKQMSIDSDLRAGLITQEEAKEKRKLLEKESQLNGSLDGAMKFVKGDSIAGIIIVVVNLVGGLAIGLLQRDMSVGDAMQIYSILTIGDGMVAQIPALLGAMAAGLLVTRTTGENSDRNLGEVIGRQLLAQPRALLVTGLIALLLSTVPGFPTLVFLALGALLLTTAHLARPRTLTHLIAAIRKQTGTGNFAEKFSHDSILPGKWQGQWNGERGTDGQDNEKKLSVAEPLIIELGQNHSPDWQELHLMAQRLGDELGVPIPPIVPRINADTAPDAYRIIIFDVSVDSGNIDAATDADTSTPDESGMCAETTENSREWFISRVERQLRKHATQFLGTQEVSNIIDELSRQYPALIKEVLRNVAIRTIAEVLRNLVDEGIPIRNLRDIFEALLEWGAKEKDPTNLTELVRIGLKRYMTARYVREDNSIVALLIEPDTEERIRQSIQQTPGGPQLRMDPEEIKCLQMQVREAVRNFSSADIEQSCESRVPTGENAPALLTAVDVRRQMKNIVQQDFPLLPVLSYQELMMPVGITLAGKLAL